MVVCNHCGDTIVSTSPSIRCSDCEQNYHASCIDKSGGELVRLEEENVIWKCDLCSEVRKKSINPEVEENGGKLTLLRIKEILDAFIQKQERFAVEIKNSLENINKEVELIKKSADSNAKKVDEINRKCESINLAKNKIKKDLKSFEIRLVDLEQYTRTNDVEIDGVPETPNEDVLSSVKDIGRGLGMDIQETMIDICHRLRPIPGKTGPRAIIVRFVRRIDKERFLKARRMKEEFGAVQIGRRTDEPIWIKESLAPSMRRLYKAAREANKQLQYKYLWTSNGKILIKHDENSNTILISCEEDLLNLKPVPR